MKTQQTISEPLPACPGSAVTRHKESGTKTAREVAAELISGICPPTWLVMCAERIKSHESWPEEPHPEDMAKTHEILDLLNADSQTKG